MAPEVLRRTPHDAGLLDRTGIISASAPPPLPAVPEAGDVGAEGADHDVLRSRFVGSVAAVLMLIVAVTAVLDPASRQRERQSEREAERDPAVASSSNVSPPVVLGGDDRETARDERVRAPAKDGAGGGGDAEPGESSGRARSDDPGTASTPRQDPPASGGTAGGHVPVASVPGVAELLPLCVSPVENEPENDGVVTSAVEERESRTTTTRRAAPSRGPEVDIADLRCDACDSGDVPHGPPDVP